MKAEKCECGCGRKTVRTIKLLPEQHRETAEALGWSELSVGPMREPVACARGHESYLDGYVIDEPA
jgi:hypothetical protein